jgi:hypothetical protein
MNNCKEPTCHYSVSKKKCVKPNPYIEHIAWCKRHGLPNCKNLYHKGKNHAVAEACNRYKEKLTYVKPKKECPEGKIRNPKTGRCIKIRLPKVKKEPKVKKGLKKSSTTILSVSPKMPSIKSLSDFSSIKRVSSSSQKQKSSQYSKVFKRQYTEKKNAKFFKKKDNTFVYKSSSDPLKKHISRESLRKKVKYMMKLKKIHRQPFIKDAYDDDKKMIDALKSQEKAASMSKSKRSSNSKKIKYMLAKKLQKFLRSNLLKKNFNLDKRIKYFKYVSDFLKGLPKKSCIKPTLFHTKKGVLNGYTVDNIIDLEKKIGTDSAYGVIYKTSVKNMLGSAPIAAKLMPYTSDNLKEYNINNGVSQKILKYGTSRHFLFTYKLFECETKSFQVPKMILNKNYYIALNEMAHGDLCSLCEKPEFLQNDELLINIFIQCMLAIATFHKLRYVHKDCHWGNFLYHLTEDKSGYYHYKIFGKDYYLKNCGYNIMIYDFGLAEKYNNRGRWPLDSLTFDYTRISHAFANKKHNGWNKTMTLPNDRISKYVFDIKTNLIAGIVRQNDENDLLKNIVLPALLMSPYPNIFIESPAANERIINSSPYIIDDTLLALNI